MVRDVNAALVSLEDYLAASYSPDREYVDGAVREIHGGEAPHSKVQLNLVLAFDRLRPNLHIWPKQRVRTGPSRVRVPDLCITLDDPRSSIFEGPPFLCIEIVSARDGASDLLEKLEEYAAMGVRHIWVLDPRRRKAYASFRTAGLVLEEIGRLAAGEAGVSLDLNEVFRGV